MTGTLFKKLALLACGGALFLWSCTEPCPPIDAWDYAVGVLSGEAGPVPQDSDQWVLMKINQNWRVYQRPDTVPVTTVWPRALQGIIDLELSLDEPNLHYLGKLLGRSFTDTQAVRLWLARQDLALSQITPSDVAGRLFVSDGCQDAVSVAKKREAGRWLARVGALGILFVALIGSVKKKTRLEAGS